jgi:glycerol-3-phosphate dehydrogenase
MYDALAGARGLGATEFLSAARTRELLPTVQARGLSAGVKYWDGQFDDARLALALARSAAARGAVVLNHCPVTALVREGGKVTGVVARDAVDAVELRIAARCVVNATGVWVDDLRSMDRDAGAPEKPGIVVPSQGVHLVVDRAFLPGTHALLVPKTADGRVLFAVPWLGKTILGTTDTPREDVVREPAPFPEEVQFILREAARYLVKAPTRADVRSVWVGLRPLVKPGGDEGDNTKAISREHTVLVGRSGLVTVTGGKWTTYRAMAEDVLERCFDRGLLPRRAGGVTVKLPLVGAPARATVPLTAAPGEHLYGDEAAIVQRLPGARRWSVARRRDRPGRAERGDGALCSAPRDGTQRRGRAGPSFAPALPRCRRSVATSGAGGGDPGRRTGVRLRCRRVARVVRSLGRSIPTAAVSDAQPSAYLTEQP